MTTSTGNRHGSAVVTLPTDTQIRITRQFDAPSALVFKAITTPELVKRWWGFDSSVWKVCDIALLMCVGACAATCPRTGAEAIVSGCVIAYWTVQRTVLAIAVAQASQPQANTPRTPLDPPDATTWNSSNR